MQADRAALASVERIPNGYAALDYLPGLHIFGIQGVALGLEHLIALFQIESFNDRCGQPNGQTGEALPRLAAPRRG